MALSRIKTNSIANDAVTSTKIAPNTVVASDILDGAVTYAKIQNVTAGKLLGRDTSGSGAVQELPIAVDTSGNVGIGTSSPNGKLNVVQSGSPIVAQFDRTDSSMGLIIAADSSGPYFRPTASGAVRWNNAANSAELMRIENDATFKFNSGYGSVATAYGCRAWVNFNGTGTVAIRASGNVTSITDNGVGDYTVNLTTAMPDTNCNIVLGQSYANSRGDAWGNHNTIAGGYMATTSTVNVQTGINSANAYYDVTTFSVSIFR